MFVNLLTKLFFLVLPKTRAVYHLDEWTMFEMETRYRMRNEHRTKFDEKITASKQTPYFFTTFYAAYSCSVTDYPLINKSTNFIVRLCLQNPPFSLEIYVESFFFQLFFCVFFLESSV